MEDQEKELIENKLKFENQLKSGAGWFFWIAGLSLVNSIVLLAGSEWSFIIGLGITQFIDAIGLEIAKEIGSLGNIFAFILDIIIAGVFIVFGIFARKKHNWSFIIGMILYALDGFLFLLVQDFLSIGFHVFALFCIYKGFQANRTIKRSEANQLSTV